MVNRILQLLGRALITLGLLMGAFVAYQLWGTGIQQKNDQRQLAREFTQELIAAPESITYTEGSIAGKISIPALRVSQWLVMGVRIQDLKKGPGIFTASALPGELGNLAIAGHRTSHGAPFKNLDKLVPDDSIIVTTRSGTYTYKVTGSEIVKPKNVEVLNVVDPTKAVVTLITCHPKNSNSRRLIIHATLLPEQTPTIPIVVTKIEKSEEPALDSGWFHDSSRTLPTILWGMALIAHWWVAQRLIRRFRSTATAEKSIKATAWDTFGTIVGTVSLLLLFVMSLYMFFKNLSGVLPTNI